MNRTVLLALAAVSLIGVAGCGKKAGAAGSGDAIANVNGATITEDRYMTYLGNMMSTVQVRDQQGRTGTAAVAQPLGFQAMVALVRDELLQQLAKDEGVFPTPQEVDAEIARRERLRPNYVKELAGAGLSVDMIKDDARSYLCQYKIITKGITVSLDEAKKYIKDHPDEFMDKAQVDLLWIFVQTPDLKKSVDTDLASGQMFAQVAQRYSQAPNARSNRGQFPIRLMDSLPDQIKTLVQKTPELKPTDWIPFSGGSAKFFVNKKIAAKAKTVDDNLIADVQRALMEQRGRLAVDLDSRLNKKLKDSLDKITVNQPGIKDLWQKYASQIKSQDNTNLPATGATAGTPGTTAGTPGTSTTPGSNAPAGGATGQ